MSVESSLHIAARRCNICTYELTRFLLIHIKLFFSFFKTLVGKEVAVELKNDVVLTGVLHSVDQYLNIKLTNVSVVNKDKYPQLTSLKNCFIRGSVVRYVQINPNDVDTELLQDATRKEYSPVAGGEK
jgi:U6 snRNA-associated Sm-like protein LSm2